LRVARFQAVLNKAFIENGFTPRNVIMVVDPRGNEITLNLM
jgi:hypothetical protein